MTERFTLEEFGLNFVVNDNGKNLTAKQTVELLNRLNEENENFKKALRIVYSTKLTEPTKHTIEQIAKHCGVDLE